MITYGDNPLHLAAQNNHLDIVVYLIKQGLDINEQNKKHEI